MRCTWMERTACWASGERYGPPEAMTRWEGRQIMSASQVVGCHACGWGDLRAGPEKEGNASSSEILRHGALPEGGGWGGGAEAYRAAACKRFCKRLDACKALQL